MRILHWLDLWWREVGGPIRSITDLSEAMRRRGHEVLIATADPRDAPDDWLRETPPRMQVFRHGLLGTIASSERPALQRLLGSVDVVHLHGLWERSTHAMALEARRTGTPYVLSTRGVLDDWAMTQRGVRKRVFLAAIGRRTLARASAIHCTSIGEARQVGARAGRPATVVPNLLGIEPLLALPRQESGTPRVLFLGRMHESKGLDLLLQAIASLPSVELDVAGSGSPQEIRAANALVDSLGISDRVRLLGHIDDAARSDALSSAWVMALPTAQENFGNAIFESLAAGVPVLTSKGLDAECELASSGGACLVERSVEAIASGLAMLVDDRGRREAMSASGRDWCRRELLPEIVGARFEAMYESARRVS